MRKINLALSVTLSMLIAVVSCVGILTPGFYAKESYNWQVQTVGQDMIDLFVIIPTLITSAILAYRRNFSAGLLWGGTIAYILYTFIIYCFDIHFNRLFIIYCFILGLSFYTLIWFLYYQVKNKTIAGIRKKVVSKTTGVYFFAISIIFYFLWLSDIVPAAVSNTVPKGVAESGLVTNPVHAIDLSVFLPAVFLTGFFLLKGKPVSFLFAVIMLAFFVLMDLTIGWLAYIMKQKGLPSSPVVIMVMTAFTLISLALLSWNIKNIRNAEL